MLSIKIQFFWLNVGMLLLTSYLLQLMKQQIDQLLVSDQQLQAFLAWVSEKSCAVTTRHILVIVRAFYFDLALARVLALVGGTLDLARALEQTLTCNLEPTLALDLALDRALGLDQVVKLTLEPNLVSKLVLERAIAHAHTLEPTLERTLLKLKEQLPGRGRDCQGFQQWWSAHSVNWIEQLRAISIEYRSLGHNWQLSPHQREALKHYYDANLLLLHCLNSAHCITRTMRSEIEETLLLPIAETTLKSAPAQKTQTRYNHVVAHPQPEAKGDTHKTKKGDAGTKLKPVRLKVEME